jgi:hypothetical protein
VWSVDSSPFVVDIELLSLTVSHGEEDIIEAVEDHEDG